MLIATKKKINLKIIQMEFKRIKEKINDLEWNDRSGLLTENGKEILKELKLALSICEVGVTFKEKQKQTFKDFINLNFYKNDIFYQSKKTGYLWTEESVLDFYKNESFIKP